MSTLTSITIISSPYHVGLRASLIHRSRVSEGPEFLRSVGLLSALRALKIPVYEVEIPPVADELEGEIGRTFELLRRTSTAVTAARNAASFPIVLAGNCCASVGVAAGLWATAEFQTRGSDALGCVWFDAHDDYNIPDSMVSGYFDSQGIAMMAGECWKALMGTIPGFRPVDLRKVIHCGVRDVNGLERTRLEQSGMGVVWGDVDGRADFTGGLRTELDQRFDGGEKGVLLHLDLDVLDVSLGKANAFACAGGLTKDDLTGCVAAITEKTTPLAFTIASFDPECDGEETARRIAEVAVGAAELVVEHLVKRGLLILME